MLTKLDHALVSLPPEAWRGDERSEAQGLTDHLTQLRAMAAQGPASWGAPPLDLVERLTDLALGGPAVLALRSVQRVGRSRFGEVADEDAELRAAARVAWGFRSFFSTPETDALVSAGGSGDYWARVLDHCIVGGLGSVLDEWFHLLPDQMRDAATAADPLAVIAEAAWRVLSLRDGQMRVDYFGEPSAAGELETRTMRTHFAMRFGQARGQTSEGDNPVDVRQAFNSPFRPFVLMSTSVGQEGLDFHHYAHAVVHWNLPSTPVDLEQREGRVHRYKNHAVRKNVAAQHGGDPGVLGSDDPWEALFELADDGDGGMRPWWVYPGDAAIERHVPLLPMSRDIGRLDELVRATALYRMTIGQPRQAELVEVLAGLEPEAQEALRAATTIDLTPA